MQSRFLPALALLAFAATPALAGDDLSLDALLGLKVTTASKKAERLEDAPGVMTVITKDDIARYGRRDLVEVLEMVVGSAESGNFVYPRNFVGVRGEDSFRANHVLYLLNGRPLRRSIDGGYVFPILKTLPVESVERVEVIRGPGSVLYGSTAYQGVINIITRKASPGKHQATVNASYGSWDSWRGRASYSHTTESGASITAGVHGLDSDGWLMEQPDSDNNPGSANRIEKDLGGTLQLGYKGFTLNTVATQGQAIGFGSSATWPAQTWDHRRVMIDGGYGTDLTDWLSVQANLTWNHSDQVGGGTNPELTWPVLGEESVSHALSNDYLAEVSAYLTPNDNVNLLVGANVERQTGRWLIGNDDVPDINTGLLPPYGEQWGAFFAQGDYRPVDNIKIVAGFQANKAGDVPWDVVPRLGVIAHANDHVGIKLLTGQAFRASYHFERNFEVNGVLAPNPDLLPEKVTTLDTQVFANYGATSTSLAAFQSEQSGLIDFSGRDDGSVVQANIPGTTVSRGLEWEIRTKPMPGLQVFGSVSAVQFFSIKDEAPQITTGLSVPVPVRWKLNKDDRKGVFAPLVMAKGGVSYKYHRGLQMSMFGTVSSKSSSAIDVEEIDQDLEGWDKAFVDLDARLQADITKLANLPGPAVRVGVTGSNILGQVRYENWQGGYWQKHGPRGLFADLEVEF